MRNRDKIYMRKRDKIYMRNRDKIYKSNYSLLAGFLRFYFQLLPSTHKWPFWGDICVWDRFSKIELKKKRKYYRPTATFVPLGVPPTLTNRSIFVDI